LTERDTELFGVGDEALHRQQFWHVGLCLERQPQTPKVGRQTRVGVALDRAGDTTFAAVVAGDRQLPIALEFVVQKLQVVERGSASIR
jgi:hypothetical protein